jgi:hypothetical protein
LAFRAEKKDRTATTTRMSSTVARSSELEEAFFVAGVASLVLLARWPRFARTEEEVEVVRMGGAEVVDSGGGRRTGDRGQRWRCIADTLYGGDDGLWSVRDFLRWSVWDLGGGKK